MTWVHQENGQLKNVISAAEVKNRGVAVGE
jgi:hypothetical protein